MINLKNQNGRSMIEMLGVLAIIGVLSVGGIAGYSKAMMKYRVNKTIEQITLIAGNIRTFFANQRNYEGANCDCGGAYVEDTEICSGQISEDGCPIIKKAKILTDEMITINNSNKITSIRGAFNNPMEIGGSSGKTFSISLQEVPEEACIDIASQDWSELNVSKISISDNDTQEGSFEFDPSVDLVRIIEACSRSSETYIRGKGSVALTLWFRN